MSVFITFFPSGFAAGPPPALPAARALSAVRLLVRAGDFWSACASAQYDPRSSASSAWSVSSLSNLLPAPPSLHRWFQVVASFAPLTQLRVGRCLHRPRHGARLLRVLFFSAILRLTHRLSMFTSLSWFRAQSSLALLKYCHTGRGGNGNTDVSRKPEVTALQYVPPSPGVQWTDASALHPFVRKGSTKNPKLHWPIATLPCIQVHGIAIASSLISMRSLSPFLICAVQASLTSLRPFQQVYDRPAHGYRSFQRIDQNAQVNSVALTTSRRAPRTFWQSRWVYPSRLHGCQLIDWSTSALGQGVLFTIILRWLFDHDFIFGDWILQRQVASMSSWTFCSPHHSLRRHTVNHAAACVDDFANIGHKATRVESPIEIRRVQICASVPVESPAPWA